MIPIIFCEYRISFKDATSDLMMQGPMTMQTLFKLILLAYYLGARVAVVPLRYGAGIKNKVIEAMAYGTPLVTTGVGAQGLNGLATVTPVTSDTQEFATHVCELINDDTALGKGPKETIGIWPRRCSTRHGSSFLSRN